MSSRSATGSGLGCFGSSSFSFCFLLLPLLPFLLSRVFGWRISSSNSELLDSDSTGRCLNAFVSMCFLVDPAFALSCFGVAVVLVLLSFPHDPVPDLLIDVPW